MVLINNSCDFDANRAPISADGISTRKQKHASDFIDKFLIALGWDVNHDLQTNPYAQEVKVERTGGFSQRRAAF